MCHQNRQEDWLRSKASRTAPSYHEATRVQGALLSSISLLKEKIYLKENKKITYLLIFF